MKKAEFDRLEQYMLQCMKDSAHDKEHIYRVLYTAMEIAAAEEQVDYDVLITACLLHDIGRPRQIEDPSLCHAQVGAQMAFDFLTVSGYSAAFAGQVAACIRSHRFRKHAPPETLEAKILFDADKVDATGTMGIARTLLYGGKLDRNLYQIDPDGNVSDGTQDTELNFFQEYHFKLKKLYDRFFTRRGAEIAAQRQAAAQAFYENLLQETRSSYEGKSRLLTEILE